MDAISKLEDFFSKPKSLITAFFLLIVFDIILYHKAFSVFFVQDDYSFLHFLLMRPLNSFMDYLALLALPGRPVSQEFYFAINRLIFGLNPIGFHVSNLILQICSVVLCFMLVSKLTNSRAAGFLGACIFLTRVGQANTIYYICIASQGITCFFFFLTFLFYLRYGNSQKTYWLYASIASCILLFRSNLNGFLFPLCATLYEVSQARDFAIRKLILRIARRQSAFYVLALLLIRHSLWTDISSPFYAIGLGANVLRNSSFYIATVSNVVYVFFPLIPAYLLSAELAIAALATAIGLLMRRRLFRFCKENEKTARIVVFGIMFYLLNLTPFIFNKLPTPPVRLDYNVIGSFGIALIVGHIVTMFFPRYYLVSILLSLAISVAAVGRFTKLEREDGIIYKSELVKKIVSIIEPDNRPYAGVNTIIVENATPRVWWCTYFQYGYEVHYGRPLDVKFIPGASPFSTTSDTLVIHAEEPNFYLKR